jgi:hypothetical protein
LRRTAPLGVGNVVPPPPSPHLLKDIVRNMQLGPILIPGDQQLTPLSVPQTFSVFPGLI